VNLLQIKKLLNKTSAYGPGGDTMDRYNCSLNDLAKFAELIVRECAGIAHGSDQPSVDIKYYFGVE
jgi:hypothetical protein